MFKSEMTCLTCINGCLTRQRKEGWRWEDAIECRLDNVSENAPLNPVDYWCASGVWREEKEDPAGEPAFELLDWGFWDEEEDDQPTQEEKEETRYGSE